MDFISQNTNSHSILLILNCYRMTEEKRGPEIRTLKYHSTMIAKHISFYSAKSYLGLERVLYEMKYEYILIEFHVADLNSFPNTTCASLSIWRSDH